MIINGALPPTGLHVTNVHSAGWSASEQAWIVLVNASTFPAILRIAPGTTHVMSYRSHLSVETILPVYMHVWWMPQLHAVQTYNVVYSLAHTGWVDQGRFHAVHVEKLTVVCMYIY